MEPRMTELERLLATAEIDQLKQRYTRLFDCKDWTALRQLYAPEIYIDIRADLARTPQAQAILPDGMIRGPARVVAFLREIGEAVTTVHHVHGMEIEFHSPTEAHAVWSMEDVLRWQDGSTTEALHGYGHYHDDLVRRDGRWLIAHSKLTRLRVDATPGFAGFMDWQRLGQRFAEADRG